MRKTLKTLAGVASGAALLLLAATPAAAGTDTFTLDDGTIDVYEFLGEDPLATVDIGDGESCSSTNSLTVNGSGTSGTLVASADSTSEVTIGSDNFLSEMELDITGTWSGTSANGSASATVTLTPLDGSCAGDVEAGTCDVIATDIDLTGVFSDDPLNLGTNDTVTLTGGNDDGELTVIDNGNGGPVCGAIGGADFGRVVVDAVALID